jgi:hypothetical protein
LNRRPPGPAGDALAARSAHRQGQSDGPLGIAGRVVPERASWLLGAARDEGGNDIAGVTVEVVASTVITGGRARVSMSRRDLHVARRHPGVETGAAVMNLWRRLWGLMCSVTPARLASRRTIRVCQRSQIADSGAA